jgi:hypothetical protein
MGRDPSGDRHRPVDSRRDDAVDPLRARQLDERTLVLGGDDCPAVGELEAEGAWITVGRDDEEAAVASGAKEAELSRAGP